MQVRYRIGMREFLGVVPRHTIVLKDVGLAEGLPMGDSSANAPKLTECSNGRRNCFPLWHTG
jgi:hypothetical protein